MRTQASDFYPHLLVSPLPLTPGGPDGAGEECVDRNVSPAVAAQSEQPSWVHSQPHQSTGSAPGRQKVVMAV